jgi:hypothetical protein
MAEIIKKYCTAVININVTAINHYNAHGHALFYMYFAKYTPYLKTVEIKFIDLFEIQFVMHHTGSVVFKQLGLLWNDTEKN